MRLDDAVAFGVERYGADRRPVTGIAGPVRRFPAVGVGSRGRRRASSLSCGAQKTVCKECGRAHLGWYDCTTRRVRDLSCGNTRVYLEFEVRRVFCRRCGKVKREQLDFLADNPFYTKRFAWFVGRRCRASTIKDVAEELNLDWQTVKELDKP